MFSSNAKGNAEHFWKKGRSLREIKRITNISSSTLSVWLRDVSIDDGGVARKETRARFIQRRKGKENYRRRKNNEYKIRNKAKEAIDSVGGAFFGQKKILCALIYYCSGSISPLEGVALTNSDPALLRTFIRLFRDSFRISESKFRVSMYLHSNHNEVKQKKFWSKIVSIPPERFSKSHIKKLSHTRTNPNYQGSLRIRYGNTDIARELLEIARLFFAKSSK